jgi:hypothetical protein
VSTCATRGPGRPAGTGPVGRVASTGWVVAVAARTGPAAVVTGGWGGVGRLLRNGGSVLGAWGGARLSLRLNE